MGLHRKSGISNENSGSAMNRMKILRSPKNLWVSKKIWGLQWIYLGLLWKSVCQQHKSGVSMKSCGSPMIIWGSPMTNLGLPTKCRNRACSPNALFQGRECGRVPQLYDYKIFVVFIQCLDIWHWAPYTDHSIHLEPELGLFCKHYKTGFENIIKIVL